MYTLGINDGHLATAALLKDGKIIACVSEERFTGIKNQPGIPVNAINHCLNYAAISPAEVDMVVFGGLLLPPTEKEGGIQKGLVFNLYKIAKPILTSLRLGSAFFSPLRSIEETLYQPVSKILTPNVQRGRINSLCNEFAFDKKRIFFLDHHLTHAYSALYSSGLVKLGKPLLIFTCDGEGDGLSASVNTYRNGKLKTISKTSMTNSLGNLYRSVTKYLGMKPLEHEYKVMGLAAYVEDKKADDLYKKIENMITVDTNKLQIKTIVNSQLFKLGYLDRYFKGYRFDYISAAVQRITENVLTGWIKASIKKTGIKNILLSGGVFMNVKANQRIAEIADVKNIYIMPSCGDESNAIGAAYWGYRKLSNHDPLPLENLYLGQEYNNKEVENGIKSSKEFKKWKISKSKNIEREIAILLSKGEIVARFSGRGEWGARALGNRSILADASRLGVIGTINKMIKSRDFWMPFAPVIMRPHQSKYIINPKDIDAPYMIITFDTTEKGREDLAAAMHQYDKTVRPQIIDKKNNKEYYSILEEFSKLTGKFGLLNTSFNLHGSPIVGSVRDALYTFDNSGLKYLAIGDYLVSKTNRNSKKA
jgi:carbamoyltransferase